MYIGIKIRRHLLSPFSYTIAPAIEGSKALILGIPSSITPRALSPPEHLPLRVPLASMSCWASRLANPPTQQLRTLVVARYVRQLST
jgi:hypothetical protein